MKLRKAKIFAPTILGSILGFSVLMFDPLSDLSDLMYGVLLGVALGINLYALIRAW